MKQMVYDDTIASFINECRENGEVTLDELKDYIEILRAHNADAHIVIAGQNGAGKSMLLHILMKKMVGPGYMDNFRFVDMSADDLIDFLATNDDTVLGVDEWNRLLGYKKHSTKEQNKIIEMIELARSHKVAIVGCIRDPRKLTLNYRNGKVGIIIWILDRATDGSGGYAAVFAGNQMVEGDDRFGIEWLNVHTPDMQSLRMQMQELPSFVGYLYIPSASDHLTKGELMEYEHRKEQALLKFAAEKEKTKESKTKSKEQQSTLIEEMTYNE